MTTTSGSEPSDAIDASSSSAFSASSRLAEDLDVGFAVEERQQAAAHDFVIVDNQHADALVRFHPVPSARDPDAHGSTEPGPARDREPPPDLGCAAPHRVQAEVAGMSCAWVEPLSVVADLHQDLPVPSLHPHERSGGLGVLDDIGQRLAPDGEELGFHPLG